MMSFSAVAASMLFVLSPSFWSHWGDGKAEISTYEVVQNRYGEERTARVAHIYVTEPFNTGKQVKSDSPEGEGVVQVLKQNRVKLFQTGIYEYSIMNSVFVPLNDYPIYSLSGRETGTANAGEPIKVTFSSQEWCGMTFHQLNNRTDGIESQSNSYFEMESDRRHLLDKPQKTLLADELFIAVRELARPLAEGEYTIYPTLEFCRLFHVDMKASRGQVKKRDVSVNQDGKIAPATIWTVTAGDSQWEFTVAKAAPHLILSYSNSEGGTVIERGTLLKSERLPYWGLHDNVHETYLEQIGLQPAVR